MVVIKPVTTGTELEAAIGIQLNVFSGEQGIPEADCHEGNEDARHVLALDGEKPVATARLICGEGELARVAVLPPHRKGGIGRELVLALEEIAVQERAHGITLHPHRHLESIYESLGYFNANDSVDVVGGHELITMYKDIGS